MPRFLTVIFRGCDVRAKVFKAHCSFKGGSGGHGNHVFALLFQLNDYWKVGEIQIIIINK